MRRTHLRAMSMLVTAVTAAASVSAQPTEGSRDPDASRLRWSAGAEVGAMVAPGFEPRFGVFAAAEVPVSETIRLRIEPALALMSHEWEVGRYDFGTVREERSVAALLGRALAGYAFSSWLTGYAGLFAGGARGKLVSSSSDSPTCGSATLWRPVFGVAIGAGARTAKTRGLELGVLAEFAKGYPFAHCDSVRTDSGESVLPDPPYRTDGLFTASALARVGYAW
jgi:hypothetical protein